MTCNMDGHCVELQSNPRSEILMQTSLYVPYMLLCHICLYLTLCWRHNEALYKAVELN